MMNTYLNNECGEKRYAREMAFIVVDNYVPTEVYLSVEALALRLAKVAVRYDEYVESEEELPEVLQNETYFAVGEHLAEESLERILQVAAEARMNSQVEVYIPQKEIENILYDDDVLCDAVCEQTKNQLIETLAANFAH